MFGPLLERMPAAAMVGLAVLLLLLILWFGWRALHSLLLIRAVGGTQEIRPGAFEGLRVKVRGLARAAPLQKDPGPGQVIWEESTRQSAGGFRSGTESYGD